MTEFVNLHETKKTEKATVFEHYLYKDIWEVAKSYPHDYVKVVWLGYCSKLCKDIFAAYTKDNSLFIYKGVKGDEF